MQIFKDMTEPEGGDYHELPSYTALTEDARKAVDAAYSAAFTSRQHLGYKIATGIAYEAAKQAITEGLAGKFKAGLTKVADTIVPSRRRTQKLIKRVMGEDEVAEAEAPKATASPKAKYPGYRTMTAAQRHNARADAIWDRADALKTKTRFNPSSREEKPEVKEAETNEFGHRYTTPKHVIRKGGFDDKYLQHDGSFGDHKTAKRFASGSAADAHAEKHLGALKGNYGTFPVSNPQRMKDKD